MDSLVTAMPDQTHSLPRQGSNGELAHSHARPDFFLALAPSSFFVKKKKSDVRTVWLLHSRPDTFPKQARRCGVCGGVRSGTRCSCIPKSSIRGVGPNISTKVGTERAVKYIVDFPPPPLPPFQQPLSSLVYSFSSTAQPPTALRKNGSSVRTCTHCVHVFCTSASDFACSVGAYQQNFCIGAQEEAHQECIVGWVLLLLPPSHPLSAMTKAFSLSSLPHRVVTFSLPFPASSSFHLFLSKRLLFFWLAHFHFFFVCARFQKGGKCEISKILCLGGSSLSSFLCLSCFFFLPAGQKKILYLHYHYLEPSKKMLNVLSGEKKVFTERQMPKEAQRRQGERE